MVVSMLMLVSGWVVSSGRCLTNCMLFMFGMSSAAPPDSMVSMFMCVSARTHTHTPVFFAVSCSGSASQPDGSDFSALNGRSRFVCSSFFHVRLLAVCPCVCPTPCVCLSPSL